MIPYGTYDLIDPIIRPRWAYPLRVWHGVSHLDRMLLELDESGCSGHDKLLLKYFCLFHDAVYIPGSRVNEEQSVQLFFDMTINDLLQEEKAQVAKLILQTKTHEHSGFDPIADLAHGLDLSVLKDPFPENLAWEKGIAAEFSWLGHERYKKGRLKFLESVYPKNPEGIGALIEYVRRT